jgi:hypothetical protein
VHVMNCRPICVIFPPGNPALIGKWDVIFKYSKLEGQFF